MEDALKFVRIYKCEQCGAKLDGRMVEGRKPYVMDVLIDDSSVRHNCEPYVFGLAKCVGARIIEE